MRAFQRYGLEHIVLCPGSRSAPLALAVGALIEESGINAYTAIDERSAAFMAIGISAASGKATIVITTSGTAVSNLLPAAVEADRSCLPIIFITADRPLRLKGCGSNQTVNQEDFLVPVCREVFNCPSIGLHEISGRSFFTLVKKTWEKAHAYPGPVHLNIPIEEPLHASFLEQKEVCNGWKPLNFEEIQLPISTVSTNTRIKTKEVPELDPSQPGIILAGPWRGKPSQLLGFRKAVKEFQSFTGWPLFADCLSAITIKQSGLISFWELLISAQIFESNDKLQVLRLGPLSCSRALESFLRNTNKKQVLITEGEERYLDPLHLAKQYSGGLQSWLKIFKSNYPNLNNNLVNDDTNILEDLLNKNQLVGDLVDKYLKEDSKITEPSIARKLLDLIPEDIPIMLSASSPVRDFLAYSGFSPFKRRLYSFRGASGIDGNLSLAIGLSIFLGPLVVVCGDLAFLHDSNALLLNQPKKYPLIILLIDNNGGGIFKQLSLAPIFKGSVDKLFSMPQSINIGDLAKAHNIPFRTISSFDELNSALEWSLKLSGPVIIRACTNSEEDTLLRKNITDGLKKYIN
ncbi:MULTISPECIES: 2-succinyl-5-enolpyruvyl-6-hydroxy-3-cyclohexene-1-carboxylic-acid synthase [Prochlorococcus]|uniref:2-succinyl-5-enolpyruvyl-6-hydroxy-3-cyclohexene-1-carboxylate synthase n=1 Tax=Prochlorococcus marinus (strain SARG / CCMP1375 / SS120) TaxID=167539 RepID=MEND_PROMA|nr:MULTISPECIES: 2-succinyl-5-enolpyruvyl-6-hydroxy-3-cyclohexene-1-carboxylic-acid synthase [Prochlorococcus]Q7VBN8.1 RecName: Full=2-succinyl-5-enolpyruvyl-6-hydroxy-3-cyclohexene-1-carboxylate synthase; Short=SEPHCHC synthase [Prochlorococcus marinus subsp. marinus str. CCMP1375]AAQ00099.1 2-succinyl-6-hydroxy-2,4-cyclohexadiene-1-carboxylate synthase [Prochlorococcus marinus subsp. marinus str. CCMP1375]KGG13895.1 2-succinyl-5-enolpyruvyl-6-hydroxy-3- cyclohexene-1-carboxylic-acid synthase [